MAKMSKGCQTAWDRYTPFGTIDPFDIETIQDAVKDAFEAGFEAALQAVERSGYLAPLRSITWCAREYSGDAKHDS